MSLFLVVRPGAPSSVLAPSSVKHKVSSSKSLAVANRTPKHNTQYTVTKTKNNPRLAPLINATDLIPEILASLALL